jgi:hypothetical protein
MSTPLPIHKTLQQEDFAKHLEHIKVAKAQAKQIMEVNAPGYTKAEAAISMAWEVLFDHFCQCPKEDLGLEELNTLSAVIHKLMSAYHQMTKIEVSLKDLRMRETLFNQRSAELQSLPGDQHSSYTFSEDEIQSFEKQFHLL